MIIPIIDNGKTIDWGKTSDDYSKYRDIYPKEFYDRLRFLGIGLNGQKILDMGTGTGVIPRTLSQFGVDYVGTDISEGQIEAARHMSKEQGHNVAWKVCPAEETGMPDNHFDMITACQCWWYFDKSKVIPEIIRILKPEGKLALLYMNWLPFEDEIAGRTEELVLKHNPDWKGCNFKGVQYTIPEWMGDWFILDTFHKFKVNVPFTRETWSGRIRACRGVGASLSPEAVNRFDLEHEQLLNAIAPKSFNILHEAWFEIYQVVK